MDLLIPEIGLVFWHTIAFLLLMFILAKFAWKPILNSLHERERGIEEALNKAELAKERMARLSEENEALLKQARAERDEILKEAKALKDKIVAEAKTQAQVEGAKLIETAKVEIDNQKRAALSEVKAQVAGLSLEIAEKILRQEFADKAKQEQVVEGLLKDIKLN